MTYEIIPIEEKHIVAFREALDYVCREKKYLSFLQAPPLEKSIEYVMANIQKDHAMFVVVSDDTVVGWCDIIPSERDVYRHVGVLGIGLLPEFRGRGIGAKLMQKSIDKAKAKGLTRIELTVYERNKNAIALYQKMGFEIEGLKKNGIRIDGVYDNVYMMALLF